MRLMNIFHRLSAQHPAWRATPSDDYPTNPQAPNDDPSPDTERDQVKSALEQALHEQRRRLHILEWQAEVPSLTPGWSSRREH